MSRSPPRSHGIFGTQTRGLSRRRDAGLSVDGKREWPDYLVFFEQLESVMHTALQGSEYGECWRGFNSHWHDDWRRKGDVVVWCLNAERKKEVEKERGSEKNKVSGLVSAKEWLKGLAGQGKAKSDATIRFQPPQSQDGKILGGGRGPYGIGGDVTHQQRHEKPKAKLAPGESTVERPFWKKRDKVAEQPDNGLWTYLWPFAKQKKRESSWWSGGKWS